MDVLGASEYRGPARPYQRTHGARQASGQRGQDRQDRQVRVRSGGNGQPGQAHRRHDEGRQHDSRLTVPVHAPGQNWRADRQRHEVRGADQPRSRVGAVEILHGEDRGDPHH